MTKTIQDILEGIGRDEWREIQAAMDTITEVIEISTDLVEVARDESDAEQERVDDEVARIIVRILANEFFSGMIEEVN